MMARPPRAGIRASKRLIVRITEAELKTLQEAAADCGQTASTFVRVSVGDAVEQFKERRVFERRHAALPVDRDRRSGQERRKPPA
jgi:uncharacterized protein (DUF1778 family)